MTMQYTMLVDGRMPAVRLSVHIKVELYIRSECIALDICMRSPYSCSCRSGIALCGTMVVDDVSWTSQLQQQQPSVQQRLAFGIDVGRCIGGAVDCMLGEIGHVEVRFCVRISRVL
jgi:hypothetical protein